MHYKLETSPHRLHIFHELTKRRIYVGDLIYDPESDVYVIQYDPKYVRLKAAIPLGPSLYLHTLTHRSEKGQLFPEFIDRIPERANPAYSDYCTAEGISIEEKNPIILLGTIGRRGPSTFVFDLSYTSAFNFTDIKRSREALNVTQHDFALAFGQSPVTLQKMENGESNDVKTLKLLEIYLRFPEVALWQLKQSGMHVHRTVLMRLWQHFRARIVKS